MDSFLNNCGLGFAIDKFSKQKIEMENLNKLTEDEIKELLPIIGDRHKLKDAIKKHCKEKRTQDDCPIARKRSKIRTEDLVDHYTSSTEENQVRKRLPKNDINKKNKIIEILRNDERLTAELTEKAENVIKLHSSALFKNYCQKMPGWSLIDFDEAKLNCPLCPVQTTLQVRKTGSFNWMVDNYKRHLGNHTDSNVIDTGRSNSDGKWHVFDDRDVVMKNCSVVLEMLEIVISEDEPNDFMEASDDICKVAEDKVDNDKVDEDIDKVDEAIAKVGEDIEKVDEDIDKVDEDIDKVDEDIEKVDEDKVDNDKVDEDIDKVDEDIDKVDEDIDKVDEDIDKVDEDIVKVDEDIDKVDEDVDKVDKDIYKVDEDIDKVEENNDKFGDDKTEEGAMLSNKKRKNIRPHKNEANENRSFIHQKNQLHDFSHPTTDEVFCIKTANCFLMRNMKKYLRKTATSAAPATPTPQISALSAEHDKSYKLKIDPNEGTIKCICGIYREGVIIQCEKCLVWQHVECTGADAMTEKYLCEKCDKRIVEKEIPLHEYTDEGYQYYLTLMRGSFQVHQTDTVYILRDIPITADVQSTSTSPPKHTYETIGKFEYNECDIFRVERLYKDDKGERFVYGHHYLRPKETFCKPGQKFYENEIVRVPLYEKLPINLIMGRCWVLDPKTFCKERPIDCEENHVYICEYRVDKHARIFSKISSQYPVCTKAYAFHYFERKLKISRNYSPHHNLTFPKPKKKQNKKLVNSVNHTSIVELKPTRQKTSLHEKQICLESHLAKLMAEVTSLNRCVKD